MGRRGRCGKENVSGTYTRATTSTMLGEPRMFERLPCEPRLTEFPAFRQHGDEEPELAPEYVR